MKRPPTMLSDGWRPYGLFVLSINYRGSSENYFTSKRDNGASDVFACSFSFRNGHSALIARIFQFHGYVLGDNACFFFQNEFDDQVTSFIGA